jgi:fructose-bisphosphate aldolase class I
MIDPKMMQQMAAGQGFIAALDQSGGSTPKALNGYGIGEDAFSSDEEMFALIHAMRTRIITSPCFNGEKVIGAILFERTMDGEADGKSVPTALRERGVVPFLKVDKGLEDEADGVQLMKPMSDLDALLVRAKAKGVFGTKMRSVINLASKICIAAIVKQQFEVADQILGHELIPMIEPEVNIKSAERAQCDAMLLDELLKALDAMSGDKKVMLKLSIPTEANLFAPLVDHPRVLRVVALSGGFARPEDLRHQMSDDEFDQSLGQAIEEIYQASAS